jgi:hypothetical protein
VIFSAGDTSVGRPTVMQRTQPERARSGPRDIDRTLHSLRRFVRLAASGNPSILMALWAPVEHATREGRELQALGDAFVGRHVIPKYRGYMQSQAMRLLGLRGGGHGRRGGGGREELIEAHGYDTKYAMHCARRGEVPFDDWWKRCLGLDARLVDLEGDDSLPDGPDRARIEAWSTTTHLAMWSQPSD